MSALDQLRSLSSAEDFFDTLGVAYDPKVVRVARLHILRRMGQYLKGYEGGQSDDDVWLACRAFLETAYQDFVKSSPIEERIFKVHKDAVAPKETPKKQLVSLSPVVVPSKDVAQQGSV
ncbi:nitrogenase stabilizing/protective protein NifW [Methylocella sp.]|uniref:nitrogenase stabilizing/protective protein NifW n=1 Tax=Methylocella sp. TaxID=1978226 RepID=UPI003783FCE1